MHADTCGNAHLRIHTHIHTPTQAHLHICGYIVLPCFHSVTQSTCTGPLSMHTHKQTHTPPKVLVSNDMLTFALHQTNKIILFSFGIQKKKKLIRVASEQINESYCE